MLANDDSKLARIELTGGNALNMRYLAWSQQKRAMSLLRQLGDREQFEVIGDEIFAMLAQQKHSSTGLPDKPLSDVLTLDEAAEALADLMRQLPTKTDKKKSESQLGTVSADSVAAAGSSGEIAQT